MPTSRGDRGRAELVPFPPCVCPRLGSICGPPAMPSDIALWWDACRELAGNLPVGVVPLSVVGLERGVGGNLPEPTSEVEIAGAEAGVVGSGELGCELRY